VGESLERNLKTQRARRKAAEDAEEFLKDLCGDEEPTQDLKTGV
jgi:hypothetical protein